MKIKQLEIYRTLSTAQKLKVGELAQNSLGIFFQYDVNYLNQFKKGNLSPFKLNFSDEVQLAPPHLFDGLHSVFSDSLPDGWGRLLMDRVFTQHHISPFSVSPLDRLAFVGETAIGALSYLPLSPYTTTDNQLIDLAELGLQAQAIFDGQTEEVLTALTQLGSSGGARPKAQIYLPKDNPRYCHTQYQMDDEAWIVKFTSQNLALQHEEGLCEAVYLQMAEAAGIDIPDWQLLSAPTQSGAKYWLAIKRFDCIKDTQKLGRLHTLTACGLLEANFCEPSLDYLNLIKVSNLLCQDLNSGQKVFRRAMFNLYSANQDDHSKNWSYLQDDNGEWTLSPCYDVTFSPNLYNEHMTAFNGYGKNPPKKALQALANQANLTWEQAQQIIEEVQQGIYLFENFAKALDISKKTRKWITSHLNTINRII